MEPGEAVDVTVSVGVEQVEVPEVYGATVDEAQAILSEAGINSEPVESTLPNDEPAGTALSTEPGVGALVEPGSTLPLYYSAGPPEPTIVTPEPSTETEAPPEEEQNEGNVPQNVPQNVQENVQENENVPDSGRGNDGGRANRGAGGDSNDDNNNDNNGGGGGND